jgi:hypothetical protein
MIDPLQVEKVVKYATQEFEHAIRRMLQEKESRHLFALCDTTTGQLSILLQILPTPDEEFCRKVLGLGPVYNPPTDVRNT